MRVNTVEYAQQQSQGNARVLGEQRKIENIYILVIVYLFQN